MFSIKSSFADCLSCKLFDAPSCILETNSKDNLENVEVVFISENPGKTEVDKEIPLIGRAGRLFRKYFDKHIKKQFKWLLTNVVLCQTIEKDGTTGNPDEEVIHRCKENCFKIIEACKPKLIVLMGASPMQAFGIAKSGITNIRGQLFKWNGYDVFLMLHPSFINRMKSYEGSFEEDIKSVSQFLGSKVEESKEVIDTSNLKSGIHHYRIPDKYYTGDYKLVDVQFLNKENKVLYIFRDKDNKKIYHTENDDYVCYKLKEGVEKKKIIKYSDLHQMKIPYKQKVTLNPQTTYEGDLKITVKHTMDYYLQKLEDEPDIPLNVLFLDIETYTESKSFSNAEEARDQITVVTFKYNNQKVTFVVDPKYIIKGNVQQVRKDPTIIICNSEKDLLLKCIKHIRSIDPDVMTGWSSNYFDFPYFINRCKKNAIDVNSISKFNQVSFELFSGYVDIAGIAILDMIDLYKAFTQSRKESYSLNAVSMDEIKEGKLETSAMFSKMYREDINRAIDYNIQDVELLDSLNTKLKHIHLQDELRRICRASFRGSRSSMGQLDSLIVSHLKEKGLSSQNSVTQEKDEAFEGAFVKEPIVGIHDHIVDLDFTSLYPSIIRTLNIGVNTFCMKLEDYKLGYDLVYHQDKLPEKLFVIINPVDKPMKVEVSKDQLLKKIKDQDLMYSINGCFFKKTETSFYSDVLEGLVKSRKTYKDKMFKAKDEGDTDKKELYNIRQMVYKVLSNALYGILGNKVFRFFNVDCARTITLTGQELIKTSILEANNYVEYLKSGKHERPVMLSKEEMYGDLSRPTKHVITGDTDSSFVTFENIFGNKRLESLDKIHEYCNEIQTYLNKSLILEILSKHNINLEWNKLELKNELVIQRALFVSKKHYVVHAIEQEGVKTDELIVMGLDTKRSDYPSYTKECLKELFNILLREEKFSISKVERYVKEIEKQFVEKINSGDKKISRPVSWVKKLKDYKSVPQGVRAMQNWNDLIYKIHDTGSKGYLFHVKGIDLEKAPKEIQENYTKHFLGSGRVLDVVVVPEDEPRLPDYFIPNIKEMVDFSWRDRYKILLKPLIEVKDDGIGKF